MTGAVLIRWGNQVPGREAKSLEVFGRSIEHFEQLAKQGRIHAHREYIALTGRAGGFTIIEGEVEELQKILIEPDTLALNSQAEAIVEDFEITLYAGGTDKAVQDSIGTYMGALGDLGYL
jgi:hypothetical protein